MSAPAPTRRTASSGPLAAVALIGAIGWLGAGVLLSMRVEGRLRRAATLSPRSCPGLRIPRPGDVRPGSLAAPAGAWQSALLDAIREDLLQTAHAEDRRGRPYHRVRPHPYVTGSRGTMLVFECRRGSRISDGGSASPTVRATCARSCDGRRKARPRRVLLPAGGAVTWSGLRLLCRRRTAMDHLSDRARFLVPRASSMAPLSLSCVAGATSCRSPGT